MSAARRPVPALALAAALALPAAAQGHQRDDVASIVRSAPAGVAVQVLGGSDHLALRNRTDRVVTVLTAGRGADLRVKPGARAVWHDPRAAWEGDTPSASPGSPARLAAWRIPVRVSGRRQAIRGEVFYVRRKGAGAALPITVGALTLLLVGGALVVVRRVGRRTAPA